ncbi:MAG TPA: CapA family protein, partial [Euzebya sp.]|nr:CapA family protein [Euzebya sp.]
MTARHEVLAPVVLGMVMSVLAVCVGGDAQEATPGASVIAVAGESVTAPTPLGVPAIPGTSDRTAGALAAPAWARPPTTTMTQQFVGGGGEATTDWSSDGGPRTATLLALVRENGSPDRFMRPPDRPYRAFSLAATGDLLIHTPVRTRAATPDGGHDFAPQLAAAYADVAAADLGLCHLEVPLDPVGPYSSYPIFNAPAQLADGIAATGWDLCSTASNHSADKGFEGLVRTLDSLDAAGVEHRGMFRTEADWLQPRLHRVQGVQIGLLSATYGLNGLPAPGGHEWSVQRIDVPVLLQRAVALREAGADVVVI